jgi:inner membrane protein
MGACIGDAVAGRSLGKKAMFLGAFAQSIPDLDFITTFWLDDADDIINHRGITHSFIFAVMATFTLAGICRYLFRGLSIGWRTWVLLFGLNIATHLFIDSFNAYGIGWLEPFSSKRFSLHLLFVADPLFSFWPFIACIALFLLKQTSIKRKKWYWVGLGIPACYMAFALTSKLIVQSDVKKALAAKGISTSQYLVTPTPFNSMLWFVAAKDDSGYYITHRSVFDNHDQIQFTWFPQNDELQSEVADKKALNKMIRFANRFYTLEKTNDTVVLNVLRFGQITGWYDPKAKFCFYYYCDRPGANEIVAQRGRFQNWNRKTMRSFLHRIGGGE